MGLEYRGSRVSEDQDIIRLLDARAAATQVTDPAHSQSLIDSRIAGLADKTYVDSAFQNYATQAEVDSAYANKALKTDIGSTLFALDANGQIPASQLPALTSRGAKWVAGGGITPRLDVGDGGLLSTSQQLSSVYVNGTSLMGGRPYHMLGFAQIEVKGNFSGSQPIVQIATNTGLGTSIADGYGIAGWMDYYHMSVLPGSANSTAWTGNRYMYLTCRSQYASSDFGSYYPTWGILLVPALFAS